MSVPLSKIKTVGLKDMKSGDVFSERGQLWIYLVDYDGKTHWCPHINLETGFTRNMNNNTFGSKEDYVKYEYRVLFNLKDIVNKTVDMDK